MDQITFLPYTPDQLRDIMAEASKLGAKEALKEFKGKEKEEWLTTQEAMAFLKIDSDEGFASYRGRHRLFGKTVGRRKVYKKSDLINSLNNTKK